MNTLELEKPLEWSELGAEPVETKAQEARRLLGSIPEDQWHVGDYANKAKTKRCAAGHLFTANPKEWTPNCNFYRLVTEFLYPGHRVYFSDVNDGLCKKYQQQTPKQRVIALLDDMIKAGF